MTSLRRISRAFLTLTMAVALFGFLPTVAGATGNNDGNSNGRGCAFGNDQKNGQTMTAPGCYKARNGNNGNNDDKGDKGNKGNNDDKGDKGNKGNNDDKGNKGNNGNNDDKGNKGNNGNSNGRGCAFGNDQKNGQTMTAPGCYKAR